MHLVPSHAAEAHDGEAPDVGVVIDHEDRAAHGTSPGAAVGTASAMGGASGGATWRTTVKVLPRPSVLATSIVPPLR